MDIKITLADKSKIRSPSVEAEARWIEDNGPISYGLPTRPTKVGAGSQVYFIRHGAMRARAAIDDIVSGRQLGNRYSYTGQLVKPAAWNVVVSRMDLSPRAVPQEGFQGYRYLTRADLRKFEVAFYARPSAKAERVSAYEGVLRRIEVDVPVRDLRLRRACRDYYGSACDACGFEFSAVYGDLAAGFIHVHHLKPLRGARGGRLTDAIRDLRPVCANCHAVMHLTNPPLTIRSVQVLVRKNRGEHPSRLAKTKQVRRNHAIRRT